MKRLPIYTVFLYPTQFSEKASHQHNPAYIIEFRNTAEQKECVDCRKSNVCNMFNICSREEFIINIVVQNEND